MYTFGYISNGRRFRGTVNGQPAPDFATDKDCRKALNEIEWDERASLVPVKVEYLAKVAA